MPLLEQRPWRCDDEDAMGKPSGHEFRDHETGLDRLSQSDGIGEQQPDSAAADRPQHGDELVGLDAKTSRLDGK